MQVLTLWSVQAWDGGARHNHKFYMETKEAAEDYLRGNNYDHCQKVELVVYKDKEDVINNSIEAIKARALLKLTPEEKHALRIE